MVGLPDLLHKYVRNLPKEYQTFVSVEDFSSFSSLLNKAGEPILLGFPSVMYWNRFHDSKQPYSPEVLMDIDYLGSKVIYGQTRRDRQIINPFEIEKNDDIKNYIRKESRKILGFEKLDSESLFLIEYSFYYPNQKTPIPKIPAIIQSEYIRVLEPRLNIFKELMGQIKGSKLVKALLSVAEIRVNCDEKSCEYREKCDRNISSHIKLLEEDYRGYTTLAKLNH